MATITPDPTLAPTPETVVVPVCGDETGRTQEVKGKVDGDGSQGDSGADAPIGYGTPEKEDVPTTSGTPIPTETQVYWGGPKD